MATARSFYPELGRACCCNGRRRENIGTLTRSCKTLPAFGILRQDRNRGDCYTTFSRLGVWVWAGQANAHLQSDKQGQEVVSAVCSVAGCFMIWGMKDISRYREKQSEKYLPIACSNGLCFQSKANHVCSLCSDNRQNKPELSLFCSLICLARGDCQLTSRIDARHHAVKQLTTQSHETQFPTLRVHPIKAEFLHWSGLRCHLGPQDGRIKLRS